MRGAQQSDPQSEVNLCWRSSVGQGTKIATGAKPVASLSEREAVHDKMDRRPCQLGDSSGR